MEVQFPPAFVAETIDGAGVHEGDQTFRVDCPGITADDPDAISLLPSRRNR